MARILVVDDEETIRKLLKGSLEREEHEVMTVEDGQMGVNVYPKFQPEIVISDLKMPKLTGFQMLDKIKGDNEHIVPFIFVTGHGDKAAAIESLRKGAFDYLEKPFDMEEIIFTVNRAVQKIKLEKENKSLAHDLAIANKKLAERLDAKTELVRRIQKTKQSPSGSDMASMEMLGDSQIMQPIRKTIERISQSLLGANMSIIITGPSGSGKEIVARLIHEQSPRASAPWVAVNCGALPENLIESELFGHEKGAFTGANSRKPGVFEMADGGTLFLDEIGELPLNLQARLLRALQEQSFRRVGGTEEIKVDVRIITATNKDLKKAITAKEFREDLYYRLNSLPIQLPSLKDRGKQEILRIATYLLKQTAGNVGGPTNFDEAARELLFDSEWQGNIRELKSVIQRAALLSEGELVSGDALKTSLGKKSAVALSSLNIAVQNQEAAGSTMNYDLSGQSYHEWKKDLMTQIESDYLITQLKKFSGNVSAMSRSMKVTRPNLCRLLKKHGLVAEDYRQVA